MLSFEELAGLPVPRRRAVRRSADRASAEIPCRQIFTPANYCYTAKVPAAKLVHFLGNRDLSARYQNHLGSCLPS